MIAGETEPLEAEHGNFNNLSQKWFSRPGSSADHKLVDERIAAIRPKTLDAVASAALPLTSLTAREELFDRLRIATETNNTGKSILIIGGAGGVGSIGIQLAEPAGLTVITALVFGICLPLPLG